jgi:hypothetical protein
MTHCTSLKMDEVGEDRQCRLSGELNHENNDVNKMKATEGFSAYQTGPERPEYELREPVLLLQPSGPLDQCSVMQCERWRHAQLTIACFLH